MIPARSILPLLALSCLLAGCGGDDDPALAGAIERALTRELGVQAHVGSAELDLVGRRVLAHDVVLRRDADTPLLRARSLSLGATISARAIDLREVELEGVEITLASSGDGPLWPSPAQAAQGGGIERLVVRDAELSLQVDDVIARLHVDELSATRRQDLHELVLSAAAGTVERGDRVQQITSLSARGALSATELQLGQLSVRGPALELDLSDAVLPRPLGSALRGRIKGAADLAQLTPWLQRAQLDPPLPPLSGRITGEGELDWKPARLAGSGRLEVSAPRVGDTSLGERVTLTLKRDGERLRAEGHVELGEGQGSLAIHGEVQPDGARTVSLALGINGVPLSTLHERFGAPADAPALLAMRLDGDVELSGTLVPLELAGPLAVRGSEIALASAGAAAVAPGVGTRPGGKPWLEVSALDLTGQARVAHDGVSLTDTRVELPQGARLGGLALTRASALLDLELGALRDLSAEGAGLALSSKELVLRRDESGIAIEGELQLGRVRVQDLVSLSGISELGKDPELARLDATGKGTLRLKYRRGRELRAALELELDPAQVLGLPFDGGSLKAQLESSRGRGVLKLERFELRRGAGKLVLAGELGAGGVRSLDLSLSQLPLAGAFGLSAGKLAGGGRLSGRTGAPETRIDLRLSGVRARGKVLGDARVTALQIGAPSGATGRAASAVPADCQRARAALDRIGRGWLLCGAGLGNRLALDLAIGADSERSLRGHVALRDLELSPWLPPPFDGESGHALASLQVFLEGGGLTTPSTLEGRVELERLELVHGGVALRSEAPRSMALRGGRLEMQALALVGKSSELTLHGHISAADGVALEGEGRVAASLLSDLSDWSRQAYGEVEVQVTLEGPLDAPALRGKLLPRGVRVLLDPTGVPVTQITGEVSFDADELRLSPLEGELGGGRVKLEGELTLAEARITSYQLALTARDVDVEPQARFSLLFDADVQITRVGAQVPLWTGKLKLERLLYARNIKLPEALIALNKRDQEQRASYDPKRDRFKLDLQVIDAGSLRVRNNFLDADVEAPTGMRIVGSDQRFGLIGELGVADGRVLFRGDEFTVTRGHMRFEDAERVSPDFDVRGVAPARKRPRAQIVFKATGGRDRFDLDVHCEPASGDEAGVPPAFACDYEDDRLRCDDFDQLLTLWVCQSDGS